VKTTPRKPTTAGSPERAALADEVVRLVATGPARSASEACRTVGVPHSRFVAWCHEDAELAERYARAREDLIERIAQETIDIADAPVATTDKGGIDSAAVQKQRLQVDTRRWLLSKLAPKRYGEKLELSGDPAAPLVSRIERAIVGVKNTPDPDA
jgi:hypothetical protein